MRKLRNLIKDKRGMIQITIVAYVTMIIATMAWGYVMFATDAFITAMTPISTGTTIALGEQVRFFGSFTIAIIDGGLVAWWILGMFKRESQEEPLM